ncbi:MAG: carboxymuconolactone decarboxylase family protein [Parvibaculaceae bacterium]
MNAIERSQASEDVRKVFEDIMRTRGVKDVNNFWKYLANEPRMLSHVWRSLKEMMGPGSLDPLTKELVYLAVSITNGCEYCRASHSAAAAGKGATPAMLAELYAVVGLANMTNRLAVAFQVPVDEQFRSAARPAGRAPGRAKQGKRRGR